MSELSAELEGLGGADITAALENVPVRAWLLDTEGVLRWQNKASRDQVGDLRGLSWAAGLTERSARETKEAWKRIVGGGESVELTVDVVELDGTIRKRDVSAAPLRERGGVIGVFGVGVPAAGSDDSGEPATPNPPSPATTELGLTDRQSEILQLLAQGKSTEQIATELVISKTTVRNHIARLIEVLGVHTRVQAIVVAVRAGLIRFD